MLILDEPTAGLDPQTIRELIDLLIDYHNQGKTVITVTHDSYTAYEIADIVYVLGEDKRILRSCIINQGLCRYLSGRHGTGISGRFERILHFGIFC